MNELEIRVVKNGYMIRPTPQNQTRLEALEEIRVFETFEALTEFLRANLSKPKESRDL